MVQKPKSGLVQHVRDVFAATSQQIIETDHLMTIM
jgi:hypothetical protein